jgi:hypothetical protein
MASFQPLILPPYYRLTFFTAATQWTTRRRHRNPLPNFLLFHARMHAYMYLAPRLNVRVFCGSINIIIPGEA